MPKSYTEELAQWVKQRQALRRRRDKNVVAFLAIRDKVQSGIEAGYAIKTIWAHLHETGRVSCRYETFLKHVHRFATQQPEGTPKTTQASPPLAQEAPKASDLPRSTPNKTGGEGRTPKPAGITQTFTFDPNADKKDLL